MLNLFQAFKISPKSDPDNFPELVLDIEFYYV